jgi:hypothetical protein
MTAPTIELPKMPSMIHVVLDLGDLLPCEVFLLGALCDLAALELDHRGEEGARSLSVLTTLRAKIAAAFYKGA